MNRIVLIIGLLVSTTIYADDLSDIFAAIDNAPTTSQKKSVVEKVDTTELNEAEQVLSNGKFPGSIIGNWAEKTIKEAAAAHNAYRPGTYTCRLKCEGGLKASNRMVVRLFATSYNDAYTEARKSCYGSTGIALESGFLTRRGEEVSTNSANDVRCEFHP